MRSAPPRTRSAFDRTRARLSRVAALCAAAALWGCAAISPKPPEVAAPALAPSADIAALVDSMNARERNLDSLQTGAVMEYRNGDDHVKAREQIVLKRPSSMRVDAMSPFGVAMVVAAREDDLQIFDSSNNTFMHGVASARTLARFVRIPMAPRDAIGLMMAIAPAQDRRTPDRVADEGPMKILAYKNANGDEDELGFEAGELRMVRGRASQGAIAYEVRYASYHDIGGVMFPYEVEAEFPGAQSHISFRYQRPIVNGAVPDSIFVLTPGPASKTVEIGAARDHTSESNG